MVMRSFRIKRILYPIKKEKMQNIIQKLNAEFSNKLKIHTKGKNLIIEGEYLEDYRIRDKVYEILEGDKNG